MGWIRRLRDRMLFALGREPWRPTGLTRGLRYLGDPARLTYETMDGLGSVPEAPEYRGLVSEPCVEAHFRWPEFRFWIHAINEVPRLHRKQWEFFYVAHALWERGMLEEGRRGLGFGVGREPLAALFASYGCDVVATDQDVASEGARTWLATGQHAGTHLRRDRQKVVSPEVFEKHVRFRPVDMNAIPSDLTGFDFCWSACAFEHLGSIPDGLRFVRESMRCLRPGGIAVHTTELNLSSNDATLSEGDTVLFRRRDLDGLAQDLRAEGHEVEPFRLKFGRSRVDRYIDPPPYRDEPHLRLRIEGYACTSMGLIVRRAPEGRNTAPRRPRGPEHSG